MEHIQLSLFGKTSDENAAEWNGNQYIKRKT